MGGAVMDEVRGGTIQGTGREPERGWRAPDRGWPRPAGYPSMMLHLASKSPRRRELLGRLGLEFGVLDLDVPEQREPGEGPADYVRRVARAKAGAGLLRRSEEHTSVLQSLMRISYAVVCMTTKMHIEACS